MAIEEMEKVLMKLAHSNSALPALKKALLLDHKALLQYFSHLKNNRPLVQNDTFFTEMSGSLSNVKTALQRSISFDLPKVQAPIQHEFQSPFVDRKYSNQMSINGTGDPL